METTALGSAYAAGLAVGFYKDLEELRDQLGVTRGSRRWSFMRERVCREWKKARSFDRAASVASLSATARVSKKERKNNYVFTDSWGIYRNSGADFARRWRGRVRAFETIKGRRERLDGDHSGLGFRRGWGGVCSHRLWQQGRLHQSCGHPGIRYLLRRLLEASSLRDGPTGRRVCWRSFGLAALSAPLEGNFRYRPQTGGILYWTRDSKRRRESHQRNHCYLRPGLCFRRNFLKDRRERRTRCRPWALPRRLCGLGHRPLARRNHWLCNQSGACPRSAYRPRGASTCRQGQVRL